MVMVGVDSGSLYRRTHSLSRRPLGAVLHSSNEPGEFSQWLCHDDSAINIVLDISIIIIIIIILIISNCYQTSNYVIININWALQ